MNKDDTKKELIKIHTEEALRHLDKTKQSFRWKAGHAFARLLEKLLFRKKPKLSLDFLEEHLNTIQKITNLVAAENQVNHFNNINKKSKILFLVSDTDIETAVFGDTHVAYDLKSALEKKFDGITCKLHQYEEKTQWTDWDIVINMLWDTSISKVENCQTTFVGWVRNYPDKWVANPSFLSYDLLLGSSQRITHYLAKHSRVPCSLFPIAANPEKFPTHDAITNQSTICFVGNQWKETRKINGIFKNKTFDFNIYGKGWSKKEFGNSLKGPIKNSQISQVYKDSFMVLDNANKTTQCWESLNSRIFNAIASKRLVITDSIKAAKLFNHPIPTYNNEEDLAEKINFYINNPDQYQSDIKALYKELKNEHTYTQRVEQLVLLLKRKLKIAIKIAPTAEQKSTFGDFYFAEDLKMAFETFGHHVNIDCKENWYQARAAEDDLVIVLRGLQEYQPVASQTNFLWIISHPELITADELKKYQHIFVASDYYQKKLEHSGIRQSSVLLQCSNTDKFFKKEIKPKKEPLLFVGNSRNVYRQSVKFAIELGMEIDVYGGGWEQFIPAKYIKSTFVSNDKLVELYNDYKIVLNDHWEDMIQEGFLSNRIFDASACGAIVLSDLPNDCSNTVAGIHYYKDKYSFKEAINKIHETNEKSLNNFYDVRSYHTFLKRIETILSQYYSLQHEEPHIPKNKKFIQAKSAAQR